MKRLLLVALMVLATLVGMVGFSCAGNEVIALQATANAATGTVGTLQATVNGGVPARDKMYYLTATGFTGGEAGTACDSGFHMASLSEIEDPGSLRYVTRHTPAYDSTDGMTAEEAQKWYRTPALDSSAYDQGSNPPSDHMGWVRAGLNMHAGDLPNCDFWQSSSDQQNGTAVSLQTVWGDSYMDPAPSLHTLWGDSYMDPAPLGPTDPTAEWHELQQTCSLTKPVWCVEDPE